MLIVVAVGCALALTVSRYFFVPPATPLDISYGFSGTSFYGISDTHRFSAELDIDDVSELPKWDRRNSNPPVSVNDAMIYAQEYRDQIVATKQFPEGSRITDVQLIPFDSRNNVWYWSVNFRIEQVGNPVEEIEIGVLMDGSVVQHEIHRRINTGWPFPDAPIPKRPSKLTDVEILEEFVSELNPSRKHAGLNIELTGILTYIQSDHSDLSSGQRFHFTSDDGIVLICDPPGGWPLRLNQKIRITGKLLGYRDLDNRDSPWGSIELLPGIRITSVGVARN